MILLCRVMQFRGLNDLTSLESDFTFDIPESRVQCLRELNNLFVDSLDYKYCKFYGMDR